MAAKKPPTVKGHILMNRLSKALSLNGAAGRAVNNAPSTPHQRLYIRTLMRQLELDSSYMTMFHRRFFEAAQIECPDPNAHIEAVLCALTKTQASALATVLQAEVSDE